MSENVLVAAGWTAPPEAAPSLSADKEALLQRWYEARRKLADVKSLTETEASLRKEVFAAFFPTPEEGTNSLKIWGGWELKGTYKLDRKIDPATLPALRQRMTELGINADTLIKMEPKLDTTVYKSTVKLQPDAMREFDKGMTIKPASPTLELLPPKDKA